MLIPDWRLEQVLRADDDRNCVLLGGGGIYYSYSAGNGVWETEYTSHKYAHNIVVLFKLDRVGPVDNRLLID